MSDRRNDRRTWEMRSQSMLAAGAAARIGGPGVSGGGERALGQGKARKFDTGSWQVPAQLRRKESMGSLMHRTTRVMMANAAGSLGWNQSLKSLSVTEKKQRARWGVADYLLGDPFGQCVLLACVALVQIALGTGLWCMTGGVDEYASTGVPQAMWISWTLFFDPGTQTAIPADERVLPKAVAIVLSVCGFAFNLVVMGLIVEYVRKTLRWWRLTRGRVVLNDHIVILGWTDRTLFLTSELCEMAQCGGGRTTIVILGDIEEDEMRSEIRLTFPNWSSSWPRVKVKVVNGKAFEVDDLMKVSVQSASIAGSEKGHGFLTILSRGSCDLWSLQVSPPSSHSYVVGQRARLSSSVSKSGPFP